MNEHKKRIEWVIENGTLVQEYGFWSIKFKGTLIPGLTIDDLPDILDCEMPHLEEEIEDGWQPIDTAPLKGQKIVVYCPWFGVCASAHWCTDHYSDKPRPYWTHAGEANYGIRMVRQNQPTHWRPMPLPPKLVEKS
jgi:hypothetical protein